MKDSTPHPPSMLRKVLTLGLVVAVLGAAVFTLYYIKVGRTRLQHLHVPAILNFRIEENLVLPDMPRPIEVMEGLPAELSCEVVPPDEPGATTFFRFAIDGAPLEEVQDCVVQHVVPGPVGSRHTVSLEYLVQLPGKAPLSIDREEAQVEIVRAGESLRIVALTTPDKEPIPTLTVPPRAIPYVRGALELKGGAEGYVALFFVDPEGEGRPVLQVHIPPETPDKFQVISSPLRRYRRFGPSLTAFAAWPKQPIQLGNLEDERMLLELYVGIFRKEDVDRVAKKLLQFEGIGPNDEVRLKVLSPTIDEIRAMAYRGLLSEPLRVVRAENVPQETKSAWRAMQQPAATPDAPPPAAPAPAAPVAPSPAAAPTP